MLLSLIYLDSAPARRPPAPCAVCGTFVWQKQWPHSEVHLVAVNDFSFRHKWSFLLKFLRLIKQF